MCCGKIVYKIWDDQSTTDYNTSWQKLKKKFNCPLEGSIKQENMRKCKLEALMVV